MNINQPEDVVSLTDFKINPVKLINQIKESHRPVLLTKQGKGLAVLQDLDDYQKNQQEIAFIKAIAQGLMDVKQGNLMDLAEVKAKLGLA